MPSGNVMSEASAMRQSLLLSAGESVGVALTEGGEAQRIQCFVRQRRVRAADAEGALRLNAFGKERVVHILHDHIGAPHARLRLLGCPVPGVLPGQLLMQAAEGAGEGGLAGAVAAAEQDKEQLRPGIQVQRLHWVILAFSNRFFSIRQPTKALTAAARTVPASMTTSIHAVPVVRMVSM